MALGVAAEESYEEKRSQVAPGDRLTFVSDGIVEARNAKGDLLVSERTAPLTNKPTADAVFALNLPSAARLK